MDLVPFGNEFPENISDNFFLSIFEKSKFKLLASSLFKIINSGLLTGVGFISSLKLLDNFE